MDENNVLTYEKIANAWVNKWQPVFDEHAEQKKDLIYRRQNFPKMMNL